jgi:predicted nucleotide-binding protein
MAAALRDWLPGVLQSIEPWLSSEDTPLGSRWATDIALVLQNVDVGILCLTRENLNSPWLLYEAGALSKRLKGSLLCPYTLDLSPSDILGPLAQFQCAQANREDTYQLLRTLNSFGSKTQLSDSVLERVFEANWPWLEERIRGLTALAPPSPDRAMTTDEKLDEILRLLTQGVSTGAAAGEASAPIVPEPKSGRRPRIFIGSSSLGLPIAEAIQLGLDDSAECTVWNQSVFDPSKTTIESLVDISRGFDGAVLVVTPDDMVMTRGAQTAAPRDNIIFEAGLFTGTLGRARTFLVHSRDLEIRLPSDLAGVTAAMYADRSDGNLHAALGPVCTRIKRALGLH